MRRRPCQPELTKKWPSQGEQVGSVARFGWHAPPGVKCHTCILTVYAHKVAFVASTAGARVVPQSFDC